MKGYFQFILYVWLVLFSTEVLSSNKQSYSKFLIDTAKSRCLPSLSKRDIPSMRFSISSWLMNLDKMRLVYENDYWKSSRLPDRVYYSEEEDVFILPFLGYDKNHKIKLTENFIINVIFHIETALEKKYADYIHFSDMGHSHLLIPKDYYEKEIRGSKEFSKIYEKLFSFEGTKFLYHTAEQLSLVNREKGEFVLPEDEHLKHRYLTRNIIGDNKQTRNLGVVQVKDLKKEYNTVRKFSGYEWRGSSYYIKAHHQGCFPFKQDGKTHYFDINFEGEEFLFDKEDS